MSEPRYFFGRQNSDEKHTEEHLVQAVNSLLANNPLSKEDIFSEITNYYDGEIINYSAFKKLLAEHFACMRKLYYSNPVEGESGRVPVLGENFNQKKAEYSSLLNEYILYSTENLFKSYNRKLRDNDTLGAVMALMAIDIKRGKQDRETCAIICIDIERNLDYYRTKLTAAVENISETYKEVSITTVIHNEEIRNKLSSFWVLRAEDLANISVDKLIVIAYEELDATLKQIESLSDDYLTEVCRRINSAVERAIDDRGRDILLKRNGWFIQDKSSLEEIGQEYGITRERVRQIEAKCRKKITTGAVLLSEGLDRLFFMLLGMKGQPYMLVEEILDEADDRDTILNACLLLDVGSSSHYRYNEFYHVIVNAEVVSVEDIEKEVEDKYGKLFSSNRIDQATKLEKEVIENIYNPIGKQGNLYKLKKYNKSSFLIDLIGELFPQGYRMYNEEDYKRLADEYVARLGDETERPSMPAVRGILGRDEFCQTDKGTYRLRSECAQIPMELFDRIIKYIDDHMPAVDYVSIYSNFENELKRLGIGNYYYMKGIIDYSLPDDLVTQRNYITEAGTRITAVEARTTYMRSFPGKFTMDDLQNRFPGVKPYVFQFLVYDEEQNGLIPIGRGEFVYAGNLNITGDHVEKIRSIIEELFRNTDSDILSSRKVYAKMRLSHRDLLDELPLIDNQFALFSLIKYLFPNEYYLDRPYISKVQPDEERITTRGIILGYLEEHPVIDYEMYKNYCFRMNIQMMYTYMQLVDELSDSYVQLNDRQMIKKEEFNISDKTLNEIDRLLEMIFSRTDKLRTSQFTGYMMFPPIRYKWSKHVLAGIVRSYFGDKYEVINITEGSRSEAVDYEIERYVV